mmetsp:Transcript_3811/g.14863  ORF Transcript_3811/g.14863 Transcript_3811/m.14863 type:complete len:352 (+) Transcript_3811:108-1163(+)
MTRAKVGAFWDYETVRPPNCVDPAMVGRNIVNYARGLGHIVEANVYYDALDESEAAQTQRSKIDSAGWSHVICPARQRKEAVGKKIIVDVMFFVMKYRMDNPQAPLTVCLVSSDGDFCHMLSKLRQLNVHAVAIHDSQTPLDLCASVDETVPLKDIMGRNKPPREDADEDTAQYAHSSSQTSGSVTLVLARPSPPDPSQSEQKEETGLAESERLSQFLYSVFTAGQNCSKHSRVASDGSQENWVSNETVLHYWRELTSSPPGTEQNRRFDQAKKLAHQRTYVRLAYYSRDADKRLVTLEELAKLQADRPDANRNMLVQPNQLICLLPEGSKVLESRHGDAEATSRRLVASR